MKAFAPFSVICIALVGNASAQNEPPEKPHLDKILEKRAFTPEETTALDVAGSDGIIDVRDLVVFLNGQPISFWFETEQTVANSWLGSCAVPIRFSKAVTGSVSFSIGGSADAGTDFTPLSGSLEVTAEYQAQIPISLLPKPTLGQARYVVLTLETPSSGALSQILPGNGQNQRYSSHVVKIVDANEGLFNGTISFPSERVESGGGSPTFVPNAAIPPSVVRAGLRSTGGTTQLVLEMPDTGLFPQGISVPVTLDESSGTFAPQGVASGSTNLGDLNREVTWTAELANLAFKNSAYAPIQAGERATTFEANLLITVSGLSASGTQILARGEIVAAKVED